MHTFVQLSSLLASATSGFKHEKIQLLNSLANYYIMQARRSPSPSVSSSLIAKSVEYVNLAEQQDQRHPLTWIVKGGLVFIHTTGQVFKVEHQ
jgi:hypothetical protein